jgi:inosine-uridine nucleoside N-ribohydrolase
VSKITGVYLHDPATLIAAVDPSLMTYTEGVVRVQTDGITKGLTVFDTTKKRLGLYHIAAILVQSSMSSLSVIISTTVIQLLMPISTVAYPATTSLIFSLMLMLMLISQNLNFLS